MVGGRGTALTGPLGHVLRVLLAAAPGGRRAAFYMARIDREVLDTLRELIESGAVRPVVERRYALGDAADALRRLGEGHAQGKIVIGV